jgi:hypothetical protein
MRSINHVNPYFRVGCHVTLPPKYHAETKGALSGIVVSVRKATIRRKGAKARRAYVVIQLDAPRVNNRVCVPQGDWRWLYVTKLSPYGFYDY